jgi:rSAM/selenodomain-associated transferase 1
VSPAAPRVVVMAKEPVPGQVKTRLCPPLSPEAAARFHAAFVEDTLRRIATGVVPLIDRVLAVTPDTGADWLERLAEGLKWRCEPQGAGDLGRRMERLLDAARAEQRTCVIVGSDTPDLPLRYVVQAIQALQSVGTDVVLGPSSDGGYYLIGARSPWPELFRNQAWGTSRVLAETCTRLRAAGAQARLLPVWHDIDDWRGLEAFARRLREPGRLEEGLGGRPIASERLLSELRVDRPGFRSR